MFVNKKHSLKMSAMFASLIFIFNCTDDNVSSFNQISPSILVEKNNDLGDLYWGQEIDNLELKLKVKDSPYISSISTSIDYNPATFDSKSVEIAELQNHLFYNNGVQEFMHSPYNQIDFKDGFFEITVGLPDSRAEVFTDANDNGVYDCTVCNSTDSNYDGEEFIDTNGNDVWDDEDDEQIKHVDGDGEIARLYLSGKNIQTDFSITITEIISYGFPGYEDESDWSVEDISIGAPIPELYFDRFEFNNNTNRFQMWLNISDLPKTTNATISVSYDNNKLFFIHDSPSEGTLINSNYDWNHSSSTSNGTINFTFDRGQGANPIEGQGSLFFLEFQVLDPDFSEPYSVNSENDLGLLFDVVFNEAKHDLCNGCSNLDDNHSFEVDFWGKINNTFEWYGCTNPDAINYSEYVINNNVDACDFGVSE